MGTRALFSTGILPTRFTSLTAAPPSAPVNTVAPALSGDFFVGQTLTCSTGTWTGSPTPTYTYQWRNAGVDIGGATNSTYVLVAGDDRDLIDCVVTATNSEGSDSEPSNAVIALQALMYYDAADTDSANIVEVDDDVSQISDKSGNGYNATQATGLNQPLTNTNNMGSFNALTFDGTNSFLNSAGFRSAMSGAVAYTIVVTYKTNAASTTQTLLSMNNGGSSILVINHTSTNMAFGGGGTGTLNLGITPNTSPHIAGISRSGTTRRVVYDGNTTTDANGGNQTFNNAVCIGQRAQGSIQRLNGDIGDFVGFNFELTIAEWNQVGNWLGTKRGVTWTTMV